MCWAVLEIQGIVSSEITVYSCVSYLRMHGWGDSESFELFGDN